MLEWHKMEDIRLLGQKRQYFSLFSLYRNIYKLLSYWSYMSYNKEKGGK